MVPRACPWGSTGVTDNGWFAFLSQQPGIDEVSRTSFYDAIVMLGHTFLMTKREISPTIHDIMAHLCCLS
jgi:hypothetical protein